MCIFASSVNHFESLLPKLNLEIEHQPLWLLNKHHRHCSHFQTERNDTISKDEFQAHWDIQKKAKKNNDLLYLRILLLLYGVFLLFPIYSCSSSISTNDAQFIENANKRQIFCLKIVFILKNKKMKETPVDISFLFWQRILYLFLFCCVKVVVFKIFSVSCFDLHFKTTFFETK